MGFVNFGMGLGITTKIAVLATPATIKTNFYQQEIQALGFDFVLGLKFLGLAKAIEENDYKLAKEIITDQIIYHKNSLEKTEVVILGCTHYPIIKDIFSQVLSTYLSFLPMIISQESLVAAKIVKYLQKHYSKNNFKNHSKKSLNSHFLQVLCTQDSDFFTSKIKAIFGFQVECVLVDI